ncbi:hypothetical protein EGW08_021390 [Elysia chlorotica]|uniref:Uncharacterized protein n=1 Tax=Elysia chlorotica TaxID=188477 RepID=A0A3S1H2E9_ELYCH|nr:hypothetical protein EGW08_021390 [Elysia chlorotica]
MNLQFSVFSSSVTSGQIRDRAAFGSKFAAFILTACAILVPYMVLREYPKISIQGLQVKQIVAQRDQSAPYHSGTHKKSHSAGHAQELESIPVPSNGSGQKLYIDDTAAIAKQSGSFKREREDTTVSRSSVDHDKKQRQNQISTLRHVVKSSSSSVTVSPRLFGPSKTSEVRQVVFIKVHKAASSTMQNILLRFAMARNLSVLLPRSPKRTSINEITPVLDSRLVISHPPGHSFDILCNHVIYNKQQIAKYIPASAVRVAILRQPLKQALSALEYYTKYYPYAGVRDGFNRYKDDPINGFLQHPEHFFAWNTRWSLTYCFINNRMSIDLGFDTTNFQASKQNKTKIRKFIKSLESDFDLMLISDYFEESLVLLRRYLSWAWRDIIYVKLNVAKHTPDSVWAKSPVLNSSAQQAFLRWNAIDIELYDHFFPVFLRKIKSEHMFSEEVNAFKQALKRVRTFCSDISGPEFLKLPKNVWTEDFSVSKSDCDLMSLHESDIVKTVRTRQLQRLKYMV